MIQVALSNVIAEVMNNCFDLASVLLPNPTQLEVTALAFDLDCRHLTVGVTSVQACVVCPSCKLPATRVHSRYTRTLADLPWADFTVRLHLTTRKWFCSTPICARRIFTERLPSVGAPWARRTSRLSRRQRCLAQALGGRAGTRLATDVDHPTSRDTLLRVVRQTPDQETPTPQHLGVDDFAFRKGQTYGTILVDLDQGRPIDVLPDRTADTLAQWLAAHPGVELVSRDRAGAYAEGATRGAPDAVQVADRWHVLKNLGDALSRLFAAHPHALAPTSIPSEGSEKIEETNVPPGHDAAIASFLPLDAARSVSLAAPQTKAERLRQQRQDRRQTRYDQVHALLEQGVSLRAIAQELHLSRGTIRNYARTPTAPTPQTRGKRVSLLDPYKSYLLERWNAGCHVGTELLREIQERGYRGGRSIAMDFIASIRKQAGVAPMKRSGLPNQSATDPSDRPPSSRDLAWLVLQRPERLDEAEQTRLLKVQQADPKLALAVTLAQEFAVMVRERQHEALDGWLERTETSGLTDLRSFAGGIRRDYAAVKAALTFDYSNGVVEGNINRLKYLKRQMYGRANFDLLRKRVLYAA